jgi:hypothetical protein
VQNNRYHAPSGYASVFTIAVVAGTISMSVTGSMSGGIGPGAGFLLGFVVTFLVGSGIVLGLRLLFYLKRPEPNLENQAQREHQERDSDE